MFKPREWRGVAFNYFSRYISILGTNYDGSPPFSDQNYLTEAEMAAEINGYEPGTVAHLYLTRLAVIIVVYRCSIFLCHLDLEMIDIEI